MTNGLDKQIYIYSLDTSAFYNECEKQIHNKLLKSYRFRDYLKSLKTEDVTRHKQYISSRIKNLKGKLYDSFSKNKCTRHLRNDSLKDNNVVAIFDSALTRTLKLKQNKLTADIIVIRSFYYKVLENLIKNGFTWDNEEYIYFSSSAGQIRTKKTVFIKKSLWDKYENTLTCGLSVDIINSKGGCNVNKLLSYKALTSSASFQWRDFNIDKAIVVPDLETNVFSLVDYIDRDSYEITRKNMDIPIEHTDGCGMILPKKSKKSFMVRLPWVKGLLVPFPFDKFAAEKGETKITDIYGKVWDIFEDDIQIIFTKSQFKMAKYYKDWAEYRNNFKIHQCQAVKLNEEEIGENALLNYQMLQTLTDITETELKELCKPTIDDIVKLGSDKETMLRILGATELNKHKNYFQEALYMYPELLNDEYSKRVIKDKKRSLIRDARSGKIKVNGKYTYLIPDLYAFCERLFLGIENPVGLLRNGEVYCNLYKEGKLDILRSPHLYREHPIRNNVLVEDTSKWFVTHGIYTSIFDTISKVLQFDK